MSTTAVVDIVCAVYMAILYARNFTNRGLAKSSRHLNMCLVAMLVSLLVDAAAYTFTGPAYSVQFRFFINLLAFEATCVNVIFFTFYAEALFNEKGKVNPWYFRIIKTVEIIWAVATAYEFIAGHLLTYGTNGVENLDYAFPIYIVVLNLAIQFYLVAVTVINGRRIGRDVALLMSVFFLAPIITSVLFSFLGVDLAYAFGAVMLGLVAEFIQKKQTKQLEKEKQTRLQAALDAANVEKQRVKMINGIMDSSNWIYEIDAEDRVVSAHYGDVIQNKVDADSVENPMLWIELVHPEDRDRVLAGFMAAITDRSGKTSYDEIFRIIDRDGNYRWSRSVGEVLHRSDGTGEYIGMSMDMTRQMEEQQKRLLGAMPLSNDVLAKANIGMWAFELDEGQPPRMYDDETMLGLVGLDHQVPPEEAYHAWYDHIDEGSYDLVTDAVNKMISGEHAEVQYPWHYPDGRTIIVRCGGVRNYEYTKGIRIEGTHQDVTQTLHFDEKMRRKEQEDLSLMLISELSESFVTLYFVDAETGEYQLLTQDDEFGTKVNSRLIHGGNFFEDSAASTDLVIYEEDRAAMRCFNRRDTLDAAFGERDSLEMDYRLIIDGAPVWYRIKAVRITDTGGTVRYAIGIRCIEEERQRLLGTMQLSNDVLKKANIGLWAFELDEGQPPRMYDDETMLGLVGLDHQVTPEEAYHAWYDNIDEGSYDLVTDAVNKMISGEHAEVQYPWHYPDGRTIIVRCGGVRNYEYTKGIRIEGTHQDVTQTLHFDEEQRKREEQQRRDELARVRAEASDKAKTEFLFNMSHDIRTPMNAILGYTDIAIRHTGEPEKVGESLQKIKMAGGHLLSLINDILEMSRIEAGALEIANAPLDIREAIEGIDLMSRALALPKSIDFKTIVGTIRDPYIYADELHVNQIVINLISNAVKYTNHGGKVEYRVEQIGEAENGIAKIRATVTDTGIGMSEEFLGHLFENFTRENDAEVSKQEGAGLGLSIVKRITDLIGGTIEVQSVKGEGSTFTVELPFRVMDAAAVAAFKAERSEDSFPEDTDLEGKRVLLVEDNEMNREIATDILEEIGLVIETAEDGDIAVKTVAEKGAGYYDFILMDIQMPVMNGYEATKAIRALPDGGEVPIIALSANAFEEDRQKSLEAGMNAHVAKPIDVQALLAAMHSLK